MAKVLSSPRVTTLNAQKATFSQSRTINIKTQTLGTAGSVATYTQKQVPLDLTVTPQVSSNGDVILNVDINRSFVGEAGVGDAPPTIEERKISTNVMVHNGQTAVIGGVYQSDSSEGETGVPGLRSIPVLGWLFKSSSKLVTKNELLVFLTPRIINSDNVQKEGTF
jgi:type IV pilus assembly protein PilQ